MLACALVVLTPQLFAQRFGGGFPHGGVRGVPGHGSLTVHFGRGNHRFGSNDLYYRNGLYSGGYYDGVLDDGYVSESPQVIVIREEAKEPVTPPAPPVVAAQPKMIEVPAAANDSAAQKNQAPVVIVLRDGQRRELTRYTMTGKYLYDSSKALETSRIAIDDLDLEATVHANAERGVPFSVPNQRNEVVVRF
jgi:hypothetical protein